MHYNHWLDGAIDFHVHSAPDSMPRYGSCIQIAQEARDAGMRGIVFKDHFIPSFVKAQLASEVVEGITLVGGLCLNNTSGGMNPHFVKWGLTAGAKQIMFPTMHSRLSMRKRANTLHSKSFSFGMQMEPVKVIEDDGENVTAETDIILKMIAEAGVILSLGHMDSQEIRAILKKTKEYNIQKIVMEHPNFYCPELYSMEDLEEFAAAGVYLSHSFGCMNPLYGRKDPKDTAAIMKAVGADHCMMMTDAGQQESAAPHESMRQFCEIMFRCGISKDEIYTMTKYNPAKLLGLDE